MANNPNVKKGVQPEWLKNKDFKSRPENINKKGPRKSIGKIIDSMKAEDDASELDKPTLMNLYKVLFNTPKEELKKLSKREDTPLGVTIIIDTLLDPRTKAKAWHDYQQYVYGKPAEELNVTTKKAVDVTEEEEEAIMKVVNGKF